MQRHDLDIVSFVFAVIFIVIGAVFVTGEVDAGEFVSKWALPAFMVGTGLVLAALAAARHRRNRELQEAEIRNDFPRSGDGF